MAIGTHTLNGAIEVYKTISKTFYLGDFVKKVFPTKFKKNTQAMVAQRYQI